MSGFRVDVAHGLAKDMSFPLISQEKNHSLLMEKMENGAKSNIHPLWDRDEVHEVYKE